MQTQQLAELLEGENVKVDRLATNSPYRPIFIGQVWGLRALFRLLPYMIGAWRLAGRVDVIHVMANSGWSWQLFTAPVVWLANLRRTPVIINYRGGEAQSYFEKSFSRVKATLGKAYAIVVPSGYLESVFRDFGVDTTIIPNIVDTNRFFPKTSLQPHHRFTLIVTRNLEPIYGIKMAIQAVARLVDSIPSLQLRIAGSGPQLGELEALVRALGLEHIVTFVGRISREEICRFYQDADVMLNPTTVDNMPNSILEARACGIAVISTNVGGVPYIVEDKVSALLLPVGDNSMMADAILSLYQDDSLRCKLVKNGLEDMSQYTWPEVKERWLNLYRQAAQRGGV